MDTDPKLLDIILILIFLILKQFRERRPLDQYTLNIISYLKWTKEMTGWNVEHREVTSLIGP